MNERRYQSPWTMAFSVARMAIGIVFVVSGLEKLIQPYQNFLLVIESYEVLSPEMALWMAHILPWVEFFTGLFILLGLWVGAFLRMALLLAGMFLGVTGQAFFRGLDIQECGCFGSWISISLPQAILLDIGLFSILLGLLYFKHETSRMSLDGLWR